MSIFVELNQRVNDIIARTDKRPEELALDHEDYWRFIRAAQESFIIGPHLLSVPPRLGDEVKFCGVRIVNKG